MPALVQPFAPIAGVVVVRLAAHEDARGRFVETFRKEWFPGAREMVQANLSWSKAGVLRGLHYHLTQADLWFVVSGQVRAGLVDLRASSPTRGATALLTMGAEPPTAVYIPPGVAHGFYADVETCVAYLVDVGYDGTDEHGVRWDDPALGLDWGVTSPILSPRDQANPPLHAIPPAVRPR
jgi:dTDP-4-dehydrorhamnose 3,5-epimerase